MRIRCAAPAKTFDRKEGLQSLASLLGAGGILITVHDASSQGKTETQKAQKNKGRGIKPRPLSIHDDRASIR